MKMTRLLAYAAVGIITGLLLENKGLKIKQKAVSKAQNVKKKVMAGAEKMHLS